MVMMVMAAGLQRARSADRTAVLGAVRAQVPEPCMPDACISSAKACRYAWNPLFRSVVLLFCTPLVLLEVLDAVPDCACWDCSAAGMPATGSDCRH